jgi:hypothetical protein
LSALFYLQVGLDAEHVSNRTRNNPNGSRQREQLPFEFNFLVLCKVCGLGSKQRYGVALGVTSVGVSAGGGDVFVEVAGTGVLVGLLTTMDTPNVEPNAFPDPSPSRQYPV